MSDTIQNLASPSVDQNVRVAAPEPRIQRDLSAGPQRNEGSAPPASRQVSLSALVESVNSAVELVSSTKITFDVNVETGHAVVQVVNKETGELIRQVPPEEVQTLASRLDSLSGLIFSKEV